MELPNGLPSHDTLSDVLGRVDPAAFAAAFTGWATAVLPGLAGEQVCLDGKTVRGSRDGAERAVHLMSALTGRARWVVAQQTAAEKANEITAIPDLLARLDLQGAVCRYASMRIGLKKSAGSLNGCLACWMSVVVGCGRQWKRKRLARGGKVSLPKPPAYREPPCTVKKWETIRSHWSVTRVEFGKRGVVASS